MTYALPSLPPAHGFCPEWRLVGKKGPPENPDGTTVRQSTTAPKSHAEALFQPPPHLGEQKSPGNPGPCIERITATVLFRIRLFLDCEGVGIPTVLETRLLGPGYSPGSVPV